MYRPHTLICLGILTLLSGIATAQDEYRDSHGSSKAPPLSPADSTDSKISAMPQGIINQLEDEGQFADLIRFLIEVSEGEPGTLERLKNQSTK